MTILGTGFDGNILTDTVDFVAPSAGISAAAQVVSSSSTMIQAISPVIPNSGCAAESLVDVRVTTSTGSDTLPQSFQYLPGLVPQGTPTLGSSISVDILGSTGDWALMVWGFGFGLPPSSTWGPVPIPGTSGPIGWCTNPSSFLVVPAGLFPLSGGTFGFGPFVIPLNPGLLGMDMEFQSLVGPNLSPPPPPPSLSGSSFTNLVVMTIT